ncbi:MAG: peptidase U32 family protein [Oscillospiraceae bacterium]|jgi:putative protease
MSADKAFKPEILAPAGSWDCLRAAVSFGADAVYLAGGSYGMRAKARNFEGDSLAKAIEYAHENGVKVHVTVNIVAHEYDMEGLRNYLSFLHEAGPDALIISDPGVFSLAGEICPGIERHVSTQASTANSMSCRFWHDLGASRIVLARELSLAEIAEIRRNIPGDLRLEAFVHGAMCMSYSGRCLLSSFLTGRDANRGECAHPCRWKYVLEEEKRPGQYMPVVEGDRGTYILNSRDLCMIDHIPELASAGIDSFKIEGRMKNALYVATVTRAYRAAVDEWAEDHERYLADREKFLTMVKECTYRPFCTGFYFGKPDENSQLYETADYISGSVYLGICEGMAPHGRIRTTQKNKYSEGDRIVVMKPDGCDVETEVLGIWDSDGVRMASACHPQQELEVELGVTPQPGDILKTPYKADAADSAE